MEGGGRAETKHRTSICQKGIKEIDLKTIFGTDLLGKILT
jgi:hypothetical protein